MKLEGLRKRYAEWRYDPRQEQIKMQAGLVRAQFKDLFADSIGHTYVTLSPEQSERIIPSAEGRRMLLVAITQFGADGQAYRCGIASGHSELVFLLNGNKASVVNRWLDPNARFFFEAEKASEMSQHGADEKSKQLQALKVGQELSSQLLEIREESPEAFIYA